MIHLPRTEVVSKWLARAPERDGSGMLDRGRIYVVLPRMTAEPDSALVLDGSGRFLEKQTRIGIDLVDTASVKVARQGGVIALGFKAE